MDDGTLLGLTRLFAFPCVQLDWCATTQCAYFFKFKWLTHEISTIGITCVSMNFLFLVSGQILRVMALCVEITDPVLGIWNNASMTWHVKKFPTNVS